MWAAASGIGGAPPWLLKYIIYVIIAPNPCRSASGKMIEQRLHEAKNEGRAPIGKHVKRIRLCQQFQTGFTGFGCRIVASCPSCSSRPLCLRPVLILGTLPARQFTIHSPSQVQICVNQRESASEKMMKTREFCDAGGGIGDCWGSAMAVKIYNLCNNSFESV